MSSLCEMSSSGSGNTKSAEEIQIKSQNHFISVGENKHYDKLLPVKNSPHTQDQLFLLTFFSTIRINFSDGDQKPVDAAVTGETDGKLV